MNDRRNESYVPLLCNYPDSEKINKVSEGAEAMFCRLLAKCDDEGNYYGSPKRLLCKLFTLRYENGTMTDAKALRYRNELETVALVTRYEAVGVEYLHVNDCKKSLRKDVSKKVFFPEFTQTLVVSKDNVTVTDTGRKRNGCVTPIQSKPIQTKPKKHKYMDFVLLSGDEYKKLVERFGEQVTKRKITELNEGIGSKGYKYKSHYFTILSWDRKNKLEEKNGNRQTGKTTNPPFGSPGRVPHIR